jgi:hypothetical protein
VDVGIYLNRLAQGLEPLDRGIEWFEQQSAEQQVNIIRELVYFVYQSHPLPSEVSAAVERSALKPTFTPCVLMLKPDFMKRLTSLANLKADEHMKSFRLLVAMLDIADSRRRKSCGANCNHWWHQVANDLKTAS